MHSIKGRYQIVCNKELIVTFVTHINIRQVLKNIFDHGRSLRWLEGVKSIIYGFYGRNKHCA